MITISVNDIFDKIMGNEEEIIIKRNNEADDLVLLTAKKYNTILEELKKLKCNQGINKNIRNIKIK
ncbi:Uncharacterised protein [Fusobacterium polymorphum]|nr:hypothetical protein [Fusobacterium polymorphum]UTI52244.1 type II toxin-antitoxin system Phd/YefM family antitoxin [Fusobacterium polymorphum]WRL68978.1 type II toxin-antitoxin system Phd/YefM family antitoxin [Fusobacterium polymorphum]CKG99507.1 Uncharacterised protein [Fusobacterium polymorphum]